LRSAPNHTTGSQEQQTKLPKPADTQHWTYRGALRARREWLNSVRGRDAYVHKGGKRRYFVSYIDYRRPQRDPEQQALKDAHSHARDLSLCLDGLGYVPNAQEYAHAINLAAHLTSALTAADAHRRFCEAEGIQRAFVPIESVCAEALGDSA
jgi:hypothetical protein